MKTARRTGGPCAPLFFAVMPILVLAGSLVEAQSVDLSDLEICAGLESDELKLACFEAIIATGKRAAEPVAEVPPEPARESRPLVVEVAESGTSVTSAIEDPLPETPPVVAADNKFGSEHLEKVVEVVPDVLTGTVVEVTKAPNRGLSFHLANGQIWRQIEPRYFPYPKDGEFDVEISTGMMGEYRLQIGDKGRKVSVRRVK